MLVLVLLLAVGALAWVRQDGDAGTARSDEAWRTQPRDPRLWPYAPTSIWNHPLGADGERVPAALEPPQEETLAVEEDLIVMAPDSPLRPLLEHDAGWTGADRCASATGRVLVPGVPVPADWSTDPGYVGSTPNHSAAILMPDGDTVLETQPLHVCPDGRLVSGYAPEEWRQGSLREDGEGSPGSHGGSDLTALGGTVRLGEWVPEREVIPHALKIEVDGASELSPVGQGFVWPARHADADMSHYGGDVPELRMGALLALPVDFDVDQLESEPARVLARTLRGYGAYVVDDTARSAVAIATEWGPAGRVTEEFRERWGFDLGGDVATATGDQRLFLTDLLTIYAHLEVVADNRPGNVGGAGERLAPWAPPLLSGEVD